MRSHGLPDPSTTNRVRSFDRWAVWIEAFCLRHWLALLLARMLLFVTLPFLAPIAMHMGWTNIGQIIYWLYRPFCHQLPQRSWFLFGPKLTYTLAEIHQVYPDTDPWRLREFIGTAEMGWKVAWSDRMVSFYTMTPVFGLLYAMLRQFGRFVRPLSLKAMLLSLVPMALDGLTHIISDIFWGIANDGGFRNTNHWLVLLTANAFPGFYIGDTFGTFNWWLRLLTGLLAAWGIAFTLLPLLDQVLGAEEQKGGFIERPGSTCPGV